MSHSDHHTRPIQLHVRLWPGADDDLIGWIASLDDLPHGEKSRRIRTALREALPATSPEQDSPATERS